MAGSAWKQLVIDWEKSGRDDRALSEHLRLCGLAQADRRLLVAMKQHGQWVRDGSTARSVLPVTMRKAAQLAGLSLGGLHKAKRRLVDRGLVRYERGTFVASWSRVWGLVPFADPLAGFDEEPAPMRPDERPVERGGSVNVHACSRPYQESKRDLSPPIPDPRNQETKNVGTSTIGAAVGELLGGGGGAAAAVVDLHAACLERSARSIYTRVRRVEDRLGIPPSDQLKPPLARRIAIGISEAPDSDVADEVERVLGSIEQKPADAWTSSPAAYLRVCAQRRRWLAGAGEGTVTRESR